MQDGDVLATKDSEDWRDIAVPAYISHINSDDVLSGYHLALIRPSKTILDGEYLFRFLSSSSVNYQYRLAATGITRYGLSRYWFDNSFVLRPPIEEQRAIAEVLKEMTAEIDNLLSKKQDMIVLLKEKRAALINQAVTKGLDPNVPMKDSGIEWLEKVPKHWNMYKLGYIANSFGGSTPNKANDEYWKGNIPWVSPKDMKRRRINDSEDHVSEKAIQHSSLHKIQPPAILIVVRGMILAHTFPIAITSGMVTINQDMKALRVKPGFNVDYVAYLLEGISAYILSVIKVDPISLDTE